MAQARTVRAGCTAVSLTRPRGVRGMVAVLAAVVGLAGVDQGTLPVNAAALERAFGVGHTQIGLLASVTTLAGAAFILPVGMLADRVNRVRLLGTGVFLWAAAAVLSGLAPSFGLLIAARVGLAAVTATAGPAVASLLGDLVPSDRRARLYSWVLVGETLGNGVGLLVSSGLAAVFSWRVSLAWPAIPAVLLGWLTLRLPEPERGGQSAGASGEESAQAGPATQVPLRQALRYVLRTPTAVILIISSVLGYFFLAGVHTFAIVFATKHYRIARGGATGLTLLLGAGGLAGLAVGGRVPDLLARRGVRAPRVWSVSAALLAAPVVLAPGLALTHIGPAIPLLFLGTLLLAAANPPLDAARLDVIPAWLWGRAEAVRSGLRSLGESAAPVTFGFISTGVFHGTDGLTDTFLVCLVPLAAAGALTLRAVRTYPDDVAAAERAGRRGSRERSRERGGDRSREHSRERGRDF